MTRAEPLLSSGGFPVASCSERHNGPSIAVEGSLRFWSSPMRQNHTTNRADVDKIRGDVKPLSNMTHELAMAAVAAELHLRIDQLELDAADSVERGAAALFLAGFGPKPAASL